jgi:hypothetical protein
MDKSVDGIKLCRDCRYSDGPNCLRESRASGVPYSKSYERYYADSDFCGPDARFFARRSVRDRVRQFLKRIRGHNG